MSNEIENRAVELADAGAPDAADTDGVFEPPQVDRGAPASAEEPADADAGGDDGIVDDDEPAPAVSAGRPTDEQQLQRIIEGALMAAGKPLAVSDLGELFEPEQRPSNDEIRAALAAIAGQNAGRGFELREVASGFRFQVVQEVAPWVGRLWEEKPQKYSRALLETLALIAYRQPITRGDIEDIRGVAVASNIVKTLLERDWVRVVGHKDVPGRPAMYATTRKFLDYFNLKSLEDLPALAELRDLDSLNAELALEGADTVLPAEAPAETGDGETGSDAADAQAVAHGDGTDTAADFGADAASAADTAAAGGEAGTDAVDTQIVAPDDDGADTASDFGADAASAAGVVVSGDLADAAGPAGDEDDGGAQPTSAG